MHACVPLTICAYVCMCVCTCDVTSWIWYCRLRRAMPVTSFPTASGRCWVRLRPYNVHLLTHSGHLTVSHPQFVQTASTSCSFHTPQRSGHDHAALHTSLHSNLPRLMCLGTIRTWSVCIRTNDESEQLCSLVSKYAIATKAEWTHDEHFITNCYNWNTRLIQIFHCFLFYLWR